MVRRPRRQIAEREDRGGDAASTASGAEGDRSERSHATSISTSTMPPASTKNGSWVWLGLQRRHAITSPVRAGHASDR